MKIKAIEIARALNLSKATVSLVLNHKPGVSEQTWRRVEEYIRQANTNDSSANKGNFKLVIYNKLQQDLVYPHSSLVMSTIQGIESVTKTKGYTLEIVYYSPSKNNMNQLVFDCENNQVVGVILMATDMVPEDFEGFRRIKKPLIVYDNYFPSLCHDEVTINNDLAVFSALRHLLDKGHRRIAYLSVHNPIYNIARRSAAARKYQKELAALLDDFQIIDVGISIDEMAYHIHAYLTEQPDRSTAFIAENHYVTIGFLNALSKIQRNLPEDYSLVCIDEVKADMMIGVDYDLSYVDIPHESRGTLTTHRLIDRIENRALDYLHIEVAPKLKIRNSVKCTKAAQNEPCFGLPPRKQSYF